MEQKRWNSIDLLRIGSFLLILIYHYLIEVQTSGLFPLKEAGIAYENANLHMAKVGVALFFMMSGFGLMCSNSSGFTLKTYIKKRFVRIFIPYYAVSLLVLVSRIVLIPGPVFEEKIPAWHVIFTLLGLDGYLKEYGIMTFHLGVGEWFVGCLILMYLVFPLLRKILQKKPDLVILIATICYLIVVAVYQGTLPSYYFFPIKLYDFIMGMYLAMKLKRSSWKCGIAFGAAAIVMMLSPWKIPLDEDHLNVIFCVLLFICVFHMESVNGVTAICKSPWMKKLSQCSYEMFLIHHWAIIGINRIIQPASWSMVVLCIIIEFVIIFVLSYVLNMFLKKIKL